MLSLFSNNTNPSPAKKQPKSDSFNLDSFISNVLPTQKTEQKPQKEEPKIDINRTDIIEHIPSKSAQKLLQKVKKQTNDDFIPKDLKKASKKFSKTMNQILLNNSGPQFSNPRARIQENPKPEKKSKIEQSKVRTSGSTPNDSRKNSINSQNYDFHTDHFMSENRSERDSLNNIPKKRLEDLILLGNGNKKRKDSDRLEKVKEHTTSKKKDYDNYDPLDFAPIPVSKKVPEKEKEKEKKKIIPSESYEPYDPLSLEAPPIRKASEDQKLVKKDGMNLLGKRLNVNGLESKYETDIVKKTKLDTF